MKLIQKVTLRKGQVLTRDNIFNMLLSARSTFQYAKFTANNGRYLWVFYNKDGTFEISTNSRDLSLWSRLEVVRRNNTIQMVAAFVFEWINKFNI